MQQKRMSSAFIIVLVVIGLIAGGACALMLMDVPSPNQPVEKELNAQAFLGTQQP